MAEGAGQDSAEPVDVPYEDEALIGGIAVDTRAPITEAVTGGPVLAHVQEFSNAVCSATGACTISTYDGHHPDSARALDILVSAAYGVLPDNFSLGDSVAAFALDNSSSHRVTYVIWRQRINSDDSRGWRQMDDRGSITQNHFDHCHVSFEADGGGGGGGGGGGLLKLKSSGERVRRLQARLDELGFNLDVDGAFGPMTEAAVKAFQEQKGLDADGVVGPITLAALGLA